LPSGGPACFAAGQRVVKADRKTHDQQRGALEFETRYAGLAKVPWARESPEQRR